MIAIAFALAGTLSIEDRLEQRAFLALLERLTRERRLPFDETRVQRVADELFGAGEAEPDAQPAALADAVATLLGERPPFAVVVARFRQIAALLAPDFVRVAPETRTTLERIASLRVPSAILCNGWSTIAQRKARCTGFEGPVLVSEDIGAAKPSREAFEALIATIALPSDRIWYVGSDPRTDVHPASAAGLRAIWLNADGSPYPLGLEPPARTISCIDEILPELCEEYTRSLLGLRYVLHSTLAWREGHFVPGVEYGLHDPATVTHVLPQPGDDS
jgi:FMN phosphatase YigB (HAD superfamily)